MKNPKSNSLQDVFRWFEEGLYYIHEPRERRAVSDMVFTHLFSLPAQERVLQAGKRLSESQIVSLMRWKKRLNAGEPVQYLTGECYFLDHRIRVETLVLIPRPETEGLVLWMCKDLVARGLKSDAHLRILDVGTGSGCIAIALASFFSKSRVMACDKDQEILTLAAANAARNQVEIDCFECNLLSPEPGQMPPASLDVVVSNPPYVRESEKAGMERHVWAHEPSAALFVPDKDPLLYYRAICRLASHWLRPGGMLYFEMNEALGVDMIGLARSSGFREVVVREDHHGKDRYLGAMKSS